MDLLPSVGKRNAKIKALISQSRHVEIRLDIILERLGSMFVKNDLGFSKVYLLARVLTELLDYTQNFKNTFIRILAERYNIICKGKMNYINRLIFLL